ncbi:hypothetical protein BD410DRAFT_897203 [Rickenella mellea]|uniref:Uncharacterized protein n=1 Tax=Rickenella mellea TaxID=50990 RepID=A0A4Y7Q9P4_9AGAM|nr:hypothetical protein BD410DRAFT_897203 [Rickenella mellea]
MSSNILVLNDSSWSWSFENLADWMHQQCQWHAGAGNEEVRKVYMEIIKPCLEFKKVCVKIEAIDTSRRTFGKLLPKAPNLKHVTVSWNRSRTVPITDIFSALGWLICTIDPLPTINQNTTGVEGWLDVYFRRLVLFARLCNIIGKEASKTDNRGRYDLSDWQGPTMAHLLLAVDHFQPLLVTNLPQGDSEGTQTLTQRQPEHTYALGTSAIHTDPRIHDQILNIRRQSFLDEGSLIPAMMDVQLGTYPAFNCCENPTVHTAYTENYPLYAFGAAINIKSKILGGSEFPPLVEVKANAMVAQDPCYTCQNLYKCANVIFSDIATGWVYGPAPPEGSKLSPCWTLFHRCQKYDCPNECGGKGTYYCPDKCVASWCSKKHYQEDTFHPKMCYARKRRDAIETLTNPRYRQTGAFLPQSGLEHPEAVNAHFPTYYGTKDHQTRGPSGPGTSAHGGAGWSGSGNRQPPPWHASNSSGGAGPSGSRPQVPWQASARGGGSSSSGAGPSGSRWPGQGGAGPSGSGGAHPQPWYASGRGGGGPSSSGSTNPSGAGRGTSGPRR